MPFLFINIVNASFRSRDEGGHHASPEAALAIGIGSAAKIVAEELVQGKSAAAVEVSVERTNGTRLLSSVVSITAVPLLVTQPAASTAPPDGSSLNTSAVDEIEAEMDRGGHDPAA